MTEVAGTEETLLGGSCLLRCLGWTVVGGGGRGAKEIVTPGDWRIGGIVAGRLEEGGRG